MMKLLHQIYKKTRFLECTFINNTQFYQHLLITIKWLKTPLNRINCNV